MSDDLRDYGYAPGRYLNKCGTCDTTFTGDKRAITCERCALRRQLAEAQATVGTLWEVLFKVRSLIDQGMGDTDPLDADDPLLRACQIISATIAPVTLVARRVADLTAIRRAASLLAALDHAHEKGETFSARVSIAASLLRGALAALEEKPT